MTTRVETQANSENNTGIFWSIVRDMGTEINTHPIWQTPFIRCLSAGWTSRQDLQFILQMLTAVDAHYRECFNILTRRIGIDEGNLLLAAKNNRPFAHYLDALTPQRNFPENCVLPVLPTFARYFVKECLQFSRNMKLSEVAGFLFATESAVVRLNAVINEALIKGEVRIGSTNEMHSVQTLGVLEKLFATGSDTHAMQDGQNGVYEAISLISELFNDLYQAMRFERLSSSIERIQLRRSLEVESVPPTAMYPGIGEIMCEERDDKRGIQFSVERYPCEAETLDPRVVRIPPGKTNNKHKHAHETLFCFKDGTGRILVGDTWVSVKPGDAVFAPRWAIHQTHNTGDVELVMLAITDYYLTSLVYVGKYDKI